MRPIDADTLIPLIQEDKIEGETLDIVKALGDGLQAETLNQTCDRHIKIIRELPTIEPKRGKWIKDGDAYALYKCSVCNDVCPAVGYADCIPEERMYKTMKYCPNCGAKMERSEE